MFSKFVTDKIELPTLLQLKLYIILKLEIMSNLLYTIAVILVPLGNWFFCLQCRNIHILLVIAIAILFRLIQGKQL
jgi:hypothetical protein